MILNSTQSTSINVTTSSVLETSPTIRIIGSTIVIGSSLITTLMLGVALITLGRCKRMSTQLKKISYNVVLSDILNAVVFLGVTIIARCLDEQYGRIIQSVRTTAGLQLHSISLASVAGLTLDRFISLTKPLRYKVIMNKRVVKILTIYIWLIHNIISLAFIISLWTFCDWNLPSDSYDEWLLYLPPRVFVLLFYVIYHPFIVYAYICIVRAASNQSQKVSRHDEGSIGPREQQLRKVTNNVARLVLTFEIINLPLFVLTLTLTLMPILQTDTYRIPINIVSFVCNCCNPCITLYYYVWEMKECRYIFLSSFLSWNRKCKTVADQLKLELYPMPFKLANTRST